MIFPKAQIAVLFFISMALMGCGSQSFFKVDIITGGIGFGGTFRFQIDQDKIVVYEQGYGPRNLLQMIPWEKIYETSIREKQATDLNEAFSLIPFSSLNKMYRAENIFDGGYLEVLVRTRRLQWPKQVRLENCQIAEINKALLLVSELLASEESGPEEALSYLSYFLEEVPDC